MTITGRIPVIGQGSPEQMPLNDVRIAQESDVAQRLNDVRIAQESDAPDVAQRPCASTFNFKSCV